MKKLRHGMLNHLFRVHILGQVITYNVNTIECYGYVEERTGGGRESFTKEMILMQVLKNEKEMGDRHR